MWSLQLTICNDYEVYQTTYAKNAQVCIKSQEGLLGYRDYHGSPLSRCLSWNNSIYSCIDY